MLCASGELVDVDCPIDAAAGEFACARLSNVRLDINKIQELVEPILRKFVNPPANDGMFDEVVKPLLPLYSRLPGISDIAQVSMISFNVFSQHACFILNMIPNVIREIQQRKVSILDVSEVFVGTSSGYRTVRKMLEIWEKMRSLAEAFGGATDDGILLAGSCIFKPFQDKQCEGGAM